MDLTNGFVTGFHRRDTFSVINGDRKWETYPPTIHEVSVYSAVTVGAGQNRPAQSL